MFDSDVAKLYNYTTKNINKAMKRNSERFPEDFCFILTEEEVQNLRFQNGTSSLERENYGRRRYFPYVYTEQGISMLAGILKNEIAIKVSINIIRAFIEMRKFIFNNGEIFQEINSIKGRILEHDQKFDEVFNELEKNQENEFTQKIFFEGQIYDAYSLIIDIIKTALKKTIF